MGFKPSKDELAKANESSKRLSDAEDNAKASWRLGDTESAKHWAGVFGAELTKKI